MTDTVFLGYALNGVDQKGRLSIPADYRAVLGRRSSDEAILISLHERAECLVACDVGQGVRDFAKLNDRYGSTESFESDQAARLALGSATRAAYDANGRIVLPADLRDLSGITDSAFFMGIGDKFEIWNPQTLADLPGLDPRLARLVRRHIELRKGGA